jgi:hypothetical protein
MENVKRALLYGALLASIVGNGFFFWRYASGEKHASSDAKFYKALATSMVTESENMHLAHISEADAIVGMAKNSCDVIKKGGGYLYPSLLYRCYSQIKEIQKSMNDLAKLDEQDAKRRRGILDALNSGDAPAAIRLFEDEQWLDKTTLISLKSPR